MSSNTGGRGEEIPDFQPAGPSDQPGSESALSEPALLCFALGVLFWVVYFIIFISSDRVGGDVGKNGVQFLGFVFPLKVLHKSYFSAGFYFQYLEPSREPRGFGCTSSHTVT